MRTTLTLDDDVARLLQEEAQRLRLPFKQVVNRALRMGLRGDAEPQARPRFQVKTHSFGLKPGVDPDRLNQFADELETEAVLANMRREGGTR